MCVGVGIHLWCFSSQNNNHCDGFFLAGSTYVRRLIDININNSHLKVCYNYYNCNYSILLLFWERCWYIRWCCPDNFTWSCLWSTPPPTHTLTSIQSFLACLLHDAFHCSSTPCLQLLLAQVPPHPLCLLCPTLSHLLFKHITLTACSSLSSPLCIGTYIRVGVPPPFLFNSSILG